MTLGEVQDVLKTQLVFSATQSLQETASTISIDSSVISSEPGGSLFSTELPETSQGNQETTLTNGEGGLMVPIGSKVSGFSFAKV